MQCSYENEDQWVLDGAALLEFEERLSWERPAISWFSLHILRQKLCSSWVHFRYQPDTAPSPLLLTISSIMKHTTAMFFEFPIEFTEFSRSQEMRPKASEFLSAASALTFQHRPQHTCIEKPSDPSVMLRDISTIIYNLPSFIVNAYRRERQSRTRCCVFQAHSMQSAFTIQTHFSVSARLRHGREGEGCCVSQSYGA